jgi:hypothetical protein
MYKRKQGVVAIQPRKCDYYGLLPDSLPNTALAESNIMGIKLFIFAEFTVHPEEFSIGRHFDAACKPRKPATWQYSQGSVITMVFFPILSTTLLRPSPI